MIASIEFNPDAFTETALKFILRKAQEWSCTPAEAVSRILDEAATKTKGQAA